MLHSSHAGSRISMWPITFYIFFLRAEVGGTWHHFPSKGHCSPKGHAHITLTGGSVSMLMTPSIFAKLSLVGPTYYWGGRPPWVPAHGTLAPGAGEGGQGGSRGFKGVSLGHTYILCPSSLEEVYSYVHGTCFRLLHSLPPFFGMFT